MIEVVTTFLVSFVANVLSALIVDKIHDKRDKHEE